MLLLRIAWPAASLALAAQELPPQDDDKEEQTQTTPFFDDTVVVSVSKLQERLVNAPASVSVLSSESIESSPAQNYGDLLRLIPGVSVVQLSARDINVASRAQNGAIVTSQLALVDGRTVYQDFFGFVSWDLLPIQTSEIDQIELIRGPVSAVWGANAMTGVVNVITKRPRDMEGTTVSVGFGGFDRSVEDEEMGSGSLFFLDATHARAVSDRFAFKVSAGIFTQHPLARPVGNIANEFETPYPSFTNQGSTQPKLDVRFDYDFAEADAPANRVHRLEFGGGYAGTEGIIYTGIGPFDIQRRTFLGYGKMNYQRESFKLNVFVNVLDGGAPALLVADVNGELLNFRFKEQNLRRGSERFPHPGRPTPAVLRRQLPSQRLRSLPRAPWRQPRRRRCLRPRRDLLLGAFPVDPRRTDRQIRRARPRRLFSENRHSFEADARAHLPVVLQPGVSGLRRSSTTSSKRSSATLSTSASSTPISKAKRFFSRRCTRKRRAERRIVDGLRAGLYGRIRGSNLRECRVLSQPNSRHYSVHANGELRQRKPAARLAARPEGAG